MSLAAFMAFVACAPKVVTDLPYSVAHRGGHIDGFIPENSVSGVKTAARYGFRAIECDVHYTRDSVMILMHDGTINRTMRNASDYSEITEPVRYRDLTYKELCDNYVLASCDPQLRTSITLFSDLLQACKEYHVVPMLHTDLVEAFRLAHEVLGDDFIAFDVKYEPLKETRTFSDCLILWDPGTAGAEEVIEKLDAIGGNCGISSMKDGLLTPEYIRAVRDAGYHVQSSIFPTPKEVQAIADGADIILSDFSLLPVRKGYEESYIAPYESHAAAKVVASEKIRSRSLDAGESFIQNFDKVEYGSIEVRIEYSGDVTLTVNGVRSYPLPAGDSVVRLGGWRFYNEAPSLEVRSEDGASIRSMTTRVYRY